MYQSIFRRDLERFGVEDDFYAVGSAANYSLLYLVTRICKEIRPRSVLDVGAGQTSVLWSRLFGAEAAGHILTVEHDPQWAETIGRRISHEILLSPLRRQDVEHHSVATYDWEEIRGRGPFDVIVCDGPVGTRRWSRLGVMNLVDETLPEDFVIVMDDAERHGEEQTIAMVCARLEDMGRQIEVGKVRGQKAQAVIAGGDYRSAAFY